MEQLQLEKKQRLAALSAMESAVLSAETQGATALLSLSAGIQQAAAPPAPPVAAVDPSEQLRSALKEISRFRARHKDKEADELLDQLMGDGGNTTAQKPAELARKMEDWLMSAGGAGMAGAVLSSFMRRQAVRTLLEQLEKGEEAEVVAMREMLGQAALFLNTLQTGGTNFSDDENAIRAVFAALIPSGDIAGQVRLYARILKSTRHRIMQGNTEPTEPDSCAGWNRVVRRSTLTK
jgi:hypothetical protein